MSGAKERQREFFEWLAKSVSAAQLSEIYQAFTDFESDVDSRKYSHSLQKLLIETTDVQKLEALYRGLSSYGRFTKTNKSGIKLAALRHYIQFNQENPVSESHSADIPPQQEISSGDLLIDRLRRDTIDYIDNRPKNGALWIAQSPKTDQVLHDFEKLGVEFTYAASKGQWWTRHTAVKPAESIMRDEQVASANRDAFYKWLKNQDVDTVELFSLLGTARKIDQLIITEHVSPLGLFASKDIETVRKIAGDISAKEAFIQADHKEKHFWKTTLQYYWQFAETMKSVCPAKVEAAIEPAPQKELKPLDPQPIVKGLTSEEDFRRFLQAHPGNVSVDNAIRAVQDAVNFARRNHMMESRLYGVSGAAARKAASRLIANKAYAKAKGMWSTFKKVQPLFDAYTRELGQGDNHSEVHLSSPEMEPALADLLSDNLYADLRNALIDKGILTLEAFKGLNLWVFMNQNGLYNISQRYKVYHELQSRESEQSEAGHAGSFTIKTNNAAYTGDTPAAALLRYVEAMASKHPLSIRSAIGIPCNGTGPVVLRLSPNSDGDLRLNHPAAYIDIHLTSDAALNEAKWICKVCKDSDLPITTEEKQQQHVNPPAPVPIKNEAKDISDLKADLTRSDDYTHTQPTLLIYKGQSFPQDSWQGIYLDVLKLLYRDYRPQMRKWVDSYLTTGFDGYFANENAKARMRYPRAFVPGCYAETNYSASGLMNRIRKLSQFFKLGDNLEIYYDRQGDTETPSSKAMPQQIAQKPEQTRMPIPEKPASPSNDFLTVQVEKALLRADLEGMTLDQLSREFPAVTMVSLKQVRDTSKSIVEMPDKLVHAEAFEGLNEAKAKIGEIIEKLLARNNGYVSITQLFEYVRAEMNMFLNDNGISDEKSVYYIARHLFEKVEPRYTFTGNKHISRMGDSAVRNKEDIIRNYAREHGGFFRYDDLAAYMEKIGFKHFGLGSEYYFYSHDDIISAESMGINDAWLDQAKQALDRLFDDVGDHVVLREIMPIWYEQMPTLPGYRPWTPLLFQYVLGVYGEKLGAKTIHAELNQFYDTLHAMLVTTGSVIQTFADAVVAHLVDNNIEGRYWEGEALRQELVAGGLIVGNELIWNMRKAIGSDPRFAWDIEGQFVTIKV